MDEKRIIFRGGSGEIEVKKSRFIADIFAVRTPEEAAERIAACRKKYYDARHHCSAFIVGEQGETMRSSDDGEPQGTAGRPMLEVLKGENLTGVLAVVTRYFGGTLLGTGGLTRAYAGAVSEGLSHCEILTAHRGFRLVLRIGYTDLGKAQYILAEQSCSVTDSSYGADVSLTVLCRGDGIGSLLSKLTDAAGGRITWQEPEEVSFALREEGPVLL